MNASDIFEEVRYELTDTDGDEFDNASLITPLNNALRYISSKSRSIRHEISFAVTEGVYAYTMPRGFLSVAGVKIKDRNRGGDRAYHYGFERSSLNESELVGVNAEGRPTMFTEWGRGQLHRTLSTPVTVVYTADNLPVGYTYPANSTGEAVFEAPQTAVEVGDTILNISDHLSECEILAIHDTGDSSINFVSHSQIMRGERNTIEVGDNLRILRPQLDHHVVLIGPATDWTDDMGDESLRMLVTVRHYNVTQAHIDDGRDFLEIDDELLEALKYRICFYATSNESGLKGAADYAVLSESEYRDNIDLVRRRGTDAITLWMRSHRYASSIRTTGGGTRIGNPFATSDIR